MGGFALAWSRSHRSLAFARLDHDAPPSGKPDASPVFAADDKAQSLQLAGIWRADNAQDLIRTLGLREGAPPHEVLAAGWRKWQTGLADRLRGPFAIAILEVASNELYLARDFTGVEPLFYTRTSDGLGMASAPGAARALGDGSAPVNLATIASFLEGVRPDKTSTFYENVTRLAPGHWMTVSPAGERIERYWTPEAVKSLASCDDAGERFQYLFDQSVDYCTAGADRLGILLSGGLDSSAIAGSVMHRRSGGPKVQSLSTTYRATPGWADGKHIDALREYFDMDFHSLPSEAHDPLADLDQYLPVLDGPSLGYGSSASNRLLPMAAGLGCTIALKGHGGDEVVSHGTGRLNELARRGQWRELWIEAEGAARLWSIPRWKVFDRYLFHRPERRWLAAKWQRLRRAPPAHPDLASELLCEELLAHRAGNDPPHAPKFDARHTERDLQLSAIDSPLQAHALETLVLSGRHHGVETAMPFFDRDLLEFSVSLPSDWKLRDGYSRYVLRKAMEGRVPDCITWRRDKNDFTNDFQIGLIERSPRLRDLVASSNSDLKGLIQPQWFDHIWSKVTHQGSAISASDARALWRVAALAMWLGGDRRPASPPLLQTIGVEGDG
ncbi:asparagine synthetase B family protein [Aurantiacibacter flavus]|uniref:asparagine synthase (glutamine-hydrolyzing) n=1 Tax=Aurantiacibacter flavus TaxID=3145232 RepID=A0ABV0CYR1_9SPHN